MKQARDTKRTSAAARVRQAQAELALAERELAKSARPWRRRLQRHRSALVLFGGFTSGLALTLFPPHWWARIGAAVGATAAGAARSALTPAVVGAVLSRMRRSDQHLADSTPEAH
jgi:hypothetical protein